MALPGGPTCSGLMLRSSMMVMSSSEARWLLRVVATQPLQEA